MEHNDVSVVRCHRSVEMRSMAYRPTAQPWRTGTLEGWIFRIWMNRYNIHDILRAGLYVVRSVGKWRRPTPHHSVIRFRVYAPTPM